MAISRTTSSCLRTVSTAHFSSQALRSAASRSAPQRCFHTPPPLFLDFLAPTWRAQRRQPPRVAATRDGSSQSQPPQRRPFSTTRPVPATAIANPRKDDDGNDLTITITPRAAHRLEAISQKDGNPDLALRVAVESGGCHGFQYLMSLVNTSDMDAEEDTLFENEDVVGSKSGGGGYKAKVLMDEPSLDLLKGSSIDYTMELIGSQFKVTGIPGATSSCGCGTSFDVAS